VPFGHLGFLDFVFLEEEDEDDLELDLDLELNFLEELEELEEGDLDFNCKGDPGLSSDFLDDTGDLALDFSKSIKSLDISGWCIS
jgi:hypothetical protein